jgi:membrane protein involved in colicin uptake
MSNNVDTIFNKVQALSEALDLTTQEKQELLQKITVLLQGSVSTSSPFSSGQQMSNTLGNVQFGSGQAAFNFKPMQNQGGNITESSDSTQTHTLSTEKKEALTELDALKQQIAQSNENPLVKEAAENKVSTLETELAKPQPDKNLIQKTIETLNQGLEGVKTLSAPTLAVAKLIANAWGIST